MIDEHSGPFLIGAAFAFGFLMATFFGSQMVSTGVSRETVHSTSPSQAYLCGYAAGIRHAERINPDQIDGACK